MREEIFSFLSEIMLFSSPKGGFLSEALREA
jgi:hypothetical protein